MEAEVANTTVIDKETENGTFTSVVNKNQNETTPERFSGKKNYNMRKANTMMFGRKESSEVEDNQFLIANNFVAFLTIETLNIDLQFSHM